jgi:methyl-accepting chemotaxis protein
MQHTAAASEELSSTAEEMSSQAIRLQEAMTFFKLFNEGGSHKARTSAGLKNQVRSEPKSSGGKKSGRAGDSDLDKNFVSFN